MTIRASQTPVSLSALKIACFLAAAAGLLIVIGLTTQWLRFLTGFERGTGWTDLFNLDRESNIPSFFSASLLLLSGGVLALIAAMERKRAGLRSWQWTGLSLVFVYLAIDEAASIHELFIRPTRHLLGEWATGFLAFAWVIPFGILLAFFLVVYFRFWYRLPSRTRALVLVGGVLYVGGAVIVELFAGAYVSNHGKTGMSYSLLVGLEESMEMFGAIVFLYAMLDYLARNWPTIQFSLSSEASTASIESVNTDRSDPIRYDNVHFS